MVSEDEIKKAEQRGYGKGYAAGKRRKDQDVSRDAFRRKRDAFWQRAFLAALPAAFAAQGWARGEKPITKLEDRVRLAAETADEAMKHAGMHL